MGLFYFLVIPAFQVFVVGVILWIGTKIANIERSRYRDCLVISLIVAIAGAVAGALAAHNPSLSYLHSLVHLILPVLLIKWYFRTSWVKSVLAGVLTGVWWLLALFILSKSLRFIW